MKSFPVTVHTHDVLGHHVEVPGTVEVWEDPPHAAPEGSVTWTVVPRRPSPWPTPGIPEGIKHVVKPDCWTRIVIDRDPFGTGAWPYLDKVA